MNSFHALERIGDYRKDIMYGQLDIDTRGLRLAVESYGGIESWRISEVGHRR